MKSGQPDGGPFVIEDWLEGINQKLVQDGVAMIGRPFEALRLLSLEHDISISFSSPLANTVFEWFKARSKPDEHAIGALFTGLFFFDARFWAVEIPVFFGTVQLKPMESLRDMPAGLQQELHSDSTSTGNYLSVWTDCLDYGLGIDWAERTLVDEYRVGLLRSGDQELRSAITQLLEKRPNPKAAMSCRMSVEMFLKAYLAKITVLTDDVARKIGHRLGMLLDKIAEVEPEADILRVRPLLNELPDINERYAGKAVNVADLWKAYCAAQYCGSALVRQCSDVDNRQLLKRMLADVGIFSAQ